MLEDARPFTFTCVCRLLCVCDMPNFHGNALATYPAALHHAYDRIHPPQHTLPGPCSAPVLPSPAQLVSLIPDKEACRAHLAVIDSLQLLASYPPPPSAPPAGTTARPPPPAGSPLSELDEAVAEYSEQCAIASATRSHRRDNVHKRGDKSGRCHRSGRRQGVPRSREHGRHVCSCKQRYGHVVAAEDILRTLTGRREGDTAPAHAEMGNPPR